MQTAQVELEVERQAAQLVTPELQTPLSQIPWMLLKPDAQWMQWVAVSQVRQLLMAFEHKSQIFPLIKYPFKHCRQVTTDPTKLHREHWGTLTEHC